jgi:hypothetical protein
VPEQKMSTRLKLIALIWVTIAVLLRVYGISGGDASIVGGLLFLIWTAPFGLIWQFYFSNYALLWMSAPVGQVVGDTVVIMVGFLFWFIFFPRVRSFSKSKRSKPH